MIRTVRPSIIVSITFCLLAGRVAGARHISLGACWFACLLVEAHEWLGTPGIQASDDNIESSRSRTSEPRMLMCRQVSLLLSLTSGRGFIMAEASWDAHFVFPREQNWFEHVIFHNLILSHGDWTFSAYLPSELIIAKRGWPRFFSIVKLKISWEYWCCQRTEKSKSAVPYRIWSRRFWDWRLCIWFRIVLSCCCVCIPIIELLIVVQIVVRYAHLGNRGCGDILIQMVN